MDRFFPQTAQMLSIGKLFAVASMVALIVGFIPWPVAKTGFYTITIKNRAYGFGSDYWAFPVGALFAIFAALYYWLPFIVSLRLATLVTCISGLVLSII